MPQDARDAAASHAANAEPHAHSDGLDAGTHGVEDSSGEVKQTAGPPPMPPDAPAAMTVQALDAWSITELAGAPGLGRLLNAVQRTAG